MSLTDNQKAFLKPAVSLLNAMPVFEGGMYSFVEGVSTHAVENGLKKEKTGNTKHNHHEYRSRVLEVRKWVENNPLFDAQLMMRDLITRKALSLVGESINRPSFRGWSVENIEDSNIVKIVKDFNAYWIGRGLNKNDDAKIGLTDRLTESQLRLPSYPSLAKILKDTNTHLLVGEDAMRKLGITEPPTTLTMTARNRNTCFYVERAVITVDRHTIPKIMLVGSISTESRENFLIDLADLHDDLYREIDPLHCARRELAQVVLANVGCPYTLATLTNYILTRICEPELVEDVTLEFNGDHTMESIVEIMKTGPKNFTNFQMPMVDFNHTEQMVGLIPSNELAAERVEKTRRQSIEEIRKTIPNFGRYA